jgi:hypothetical protein
MTTRCQWTTSPIGCPWPQPRQPAVWMGRRPCPLTVPRWNQRQRRTGGSGNGTGSARSCPKKTGSVPKHPPKFSRRPPQRRLRRRGHRLTTRPDREPGLTGPSLRGGEPDVFRMATDPGTDKYRDRPGPCPRHSRLALRSGAAGVRMSVGCGSSVACGPGAAPAADSQAGSSRSCLRHCCCHPGADAQTASSFQGRENIVS